MNVHAFCTNGCKWHPRGPWADVAPAARAHEATTGHRVQISDCGPIVAPWPREMWAMAS